MTEFIIQDANCLFTIITFNKINYGIISVYRSPSGNIIKFIEDLEVIITNLFNSYRQLTLILIGDMNINLLDTTNSTTLYYDLLNSFNFIQYINCPTRPLTNSCIDHIFIRDNHKHYNIHSAVIESPITDHYPLFYS